MKADDPADRESVRSVLAGDRNAFREIVDRYTPVLFSLCYRMLGDSHTAEEAVQEIFVRIYRSLRRYDLERRFFTWMYTIALNYLRSVRRSSRWKEKDKILSFQESAYLQAEAHSSTEPEEETVRREAERAVMKAAALLPVKYREVFVMREIEGISGQETAEILGIPENTVKTRLRRAREQMKKNLISLDWK
ncbi:MAG: RNA polymerase sigma factor [Sediminispirochaetaceae bacterium]